MWPGMNVAAPTAHLSEYASHYRDFQWNLPERYNIGVAVCDQWASREPDRPALLAFDGLQRALTFGELAAQSNRLANGLATLGVKRGDRVAMLLPQGFETLIGHVATYKLGAIAVPLALLFGPDALEFRLRFSGATAVITNAAGAHTIAALRQQLPGLRHVIVVDGEGEGDLDLRALIAAASPDFEPAGTTPDDPALMIFTSGTTGPPKGALHGHRVLLGHLPGAQMAYDFMPRHGDVMWTPADWAWAGGLLNALFPALTCGVPVAFGRFERFQPEIALSLMEKLGVTLAFLPPTAIRMMRAQPAAFAGRNLKLRAIMSAGEQLGRETFDWAQQAFGFPVNEFYGQTECNLVIGSSSLLGATRPGATGKPVPGHSVAVIDGEGNEKPVGEVGQIAVRSPDPVMFLGYWRDEDATARKFLGDWMITGDQGHIDADGFIHFFGRDDDVITSAGYRIGPGEIEDCLISYPAIKLAAAVGKPDPVRTEIVKAYVVLRDGFEAGGDLADDIKRWVRDRLSAHEYPREIEFVAEIPLTTTGKVIRRHFRELARMEAAQV